MQAEILVREGIKTPAELAELEAQALMRLLNLDAETAARIIEAASQADEAKADAPPDEPLDEETEELLANAVFDPTTVAQEESSADKDERVEMFLKLRGVGEAQATALADAGYATIGDIIADSADEVAEKANIPLGIARTVQIAADRYMQEQSEEKKPST